jgi:hypothetical protein
MPAKRSSHSSGANVLAMTPQESIIHLQQTIGNQAVQRLMHSNARNNGTKTGIQTKFKVSQPGDVYEQEAERAAKMVTSMATFSSTDNLSSQEDGKVRRKCVTCKKRKEDNKKRMSPKVSRKSSSGANSVQVSDKTANEIHSIQSRVGVPLDLSTKQFMESTFGYDFGQVRIHTGERETKSTKSVDALAYTVGNDIVLGKSYSPNSLEDRRLIAHELAHVAQQQSATVVQRDPQGKSQNLVSLPPVEEIRARYRALNAVLLRLAKKYAVDREAFVHIVDALSLLSYQQALIAAQSGALPPDDHRAFSMATENAAEILERSEDVLENLDMQRETFLTSQEVKEDARAGYVQVIDRVRVAYFGAIARSLTPDGIQKFNEAESKAETISHSLIEVDLKLYETRKPSYEKLEPSRKSMADWAGWIRRELDTLKKLMADVKVAKQTGSPDLPTKQAALDEEQILIEASLEGLGHWENAMRAFEYNVEEGNWFVWTAYRSLAGIIARCFLMYNSALSRDTKALREHVNKHAHDPNVAEFYKGLPLYVFGSRFATSLAITFTAALVSGGVGGLIRGGLAARGMTGLLASAGTVAVEALTFTLVSRGLQSVMLGQGPNDSFIADFMWNAGLFAALRVMGKGIETALGTLKVPALTGTVTTAASYPLLHYYGILRFRIASGRWPTEDEMAQMAAENFIMLAGLTVGLSAAKGLLSSKGKPTELGKFHKKYGWRIEAIASLRRTMETRVQELGKKTVKLSPDEVAQLKRQAEIVEQELQKLINETKADKTLSLGRIRTELEAAEKIVAEGQSELFQTELGILSSAEIIGLRRGGPKSERVFTYKWNGTNTLEAALRKLGATVEKTIDPTTRLRTLDVVFEKTDLHYTFQERHQLTPEHPVDFADPGVQKLFTDFGVVDPKVQRLIHMLVEKQLAKNPSHGVTSAVKGVRSILNKLQKGPKESVEKLLLERGPEADKLMRTHPRLVKEAERLDAAGLTKSDQWLDARSDGQLMGALGEWLTGSQIKSALVLSAAVAKPGESAFSNIKFIGDAFVDAKAQIPYKRDTGEPLTNTDIGSELDFMLAIGGKKPATFEYTGIINVKTDPTSKAHRGAVEQNRNALERLDAHVENRLGEHKENGVTVYWFKVKQVTATDLIRSQIVDLTGRLERSSTVRQETMGPKGAKQYTHQIPYDKRQLEILVRLLKEISLRRSIEE